MKKFKRVTVNNLNKVSAQEVFDWVANHLLTQNEKSTDGSGNCVYLNQDGLKCAAGCLFTTRTYHKTYEDRSWFILVNQNKIVPDHEALISELQQIHDEEPTTYWKSALQELAESCELKFKF